MVTHTAEAPLDLVTLPSVVDRYFTSFNAADYRAVADLFGGDGVMLAPFEAPIVGSEAIYTYLQAEAIAMQVTPISVEAIPRDNGLQQVVVKGRVKTLLFSVNVRWIFDLTAVDTLQSVEIKLLASLQELMQFDRGKS